MPELRNPFSTKGRKKSQTFDFDSNSTAPKSPSSLKCPKCSTPINFASVSTDKFQSSSTASSASQICFLADYSPVPLLLVSPASVVEASNKAASQLFSNLVTEYGSLNKVHVGELGVEFPDKRWVTLPMYLERKRAVSMGQVMSPLNTTTEEDEAQDYIGQESVASKSSPKLVRASDAVRKTIGVSKSRQNVRKSKSPDDSPNVSSNETVEVYLRRLKLVNGDQRGGSRISMSQGRDSTDPEMRDYVLTPATLMISFVNNSDGEMYSVITIVVCENPVSISGSKASITRPASISVANGPEADASSLILSPTLEQTRAEVIIDDLAQRADKLRDTALEHLDSQFIAFNVRGDLAVSNKVTREFFGFDESSTQRSGQSHQEWVPRLNIYDPAFKSGVPFNEWFFHNLRKQTVGFQKSIGVYIKDSPRLLEISGEPLWSETTTPWLRNLDRELIGFLTIFRDITRRQELETLHDRDENLRGIFTSGAVSELRTPIAGIVALLQLLNETKLQAEQTTHLMGLLRSVNYLLIAIDDIVDFSRIELQGDTALPKPKSFNIYHLLNNVSKLAFHTFSKKEVQYTVDVEGLKSVTTIKTPGYVYKVDENHDLDVHMECIVSGDEWRMSRVLANVLSNAFKYTSQGYVNLRVHVLYEADGICNISFEVKDTGIGISDEAGSTLFKPFVENVESNRKQTDGLGLYVTQRLIHQMGGSIKYFSTLGIGSVFKIKIPFRRDPKLSVKAVHGREAEDLLQATSAILQLDYTERRRNSNPLSLQLPANSEEDEDESPTGCIPSIQDAMPELKLHSDGENFEPQTTNSINMDQPIPTSQTSATELKPVSGSRRTSNRSEASAHFPHSKPSVGHNMERIALASQLHGTKVMVVEDNWALQNITKLRLEKLGCLPIVAVNGLEALRMLSTRKADPDVILMDLQMPLMDGYQATTLIRTTEDPVLKCFQNIPIVAFTASSADEDRERAFSCGMSDYLAKPVGMAALSELLHRLTSKEATPESVSSSVKVDEEPSLK